MTRPIAFLFAVLLPRASGYRLSIGEDGKLGAVHYPNTFVDDRHEAEAWKEGMPLYQTVWTPGWGKHTRIKASDVKEGPV